MTLRLEDGLARELEAIARVENISVSAAVREAILEHVKAKRDSAEFQARLARHMEEDREILDRLAR
jgi:predicted transcriptional regulator